MPACLLACLLKAVKINPIIMMHILVASSPFPADCPFPVRLDTRGSPPYAPTTHCSLDIQCALRTYRDGESPRTVSMVLMTTITSYHVHSRRRRRCRFGRRFCGSLLRTGPPGFICSSTNDAIQSYTQIFLFGSIIIFFARVVTQILPRAV